MKKKIQKPANWQDFESLCKMLWGEVWKIPNEIKKHGRNGQPQSGVDVYGIPKGHEKYSGIQCKGKDDYLGVKLTKKEIDDEIGKAKKFKPALETFIIATSADKDVVIEEYVRSCDLESRNSGSFKILLFDWEEIADLIETNRETFNYYVAGNQFRSEFDFTLTFADGKEEITVRPTYKRTTTKYGLKSDPGFELAEPWSFKPIDIMDYLHPKERWINKAWITLPLQFQNSGSRVIENYTLYLNPEINKVRKITKSKSSSWMFPDLQISPLYISEEEKYGVYLSLEDKPLIQKDWGSFEFYLLVEHEATELKIDYELRARDFSKEGTLIVNIHPEIIEETKLEDIQHEFLRREDFILMSDYGEKVVD